MKVLKYLFLGIFIMCKHLFKLLLIIFVINFAFINIFYINNVSFDVDNIKTINRTCSLTIMAENFSNYEHEIFISAPVTPENIASLDYILWNYLILTLISFCTSTFSKNNSRILKVILSGCCNFSMFLESSKQFNWFWFKILL